VRQVSQPVAPDPPLGVALRSGIIVGWTTTGQERAVLPKEQDEIRRFLSASDWFRGFPAPLQDLILERSVVRKFAKGQVISVEDSEPDAFYVVLDGLIYMVREVGGGDEALIHVGEPGFWYGLHYMLTGTRTVATVLAHTPVRALMLSKSQFDRILAGDPRYYECFARLVLDRYGILVRWFAEVRDLAPEARVRGRLASMATMRRQDRPESGAVSLAVSQADLARMAGISRQTLNAILGKLEKAGLIEVGFRRIRVLDAARLADPNAAAEITVQQARDRQQRAARQPKAANGKRIA
jgi:CRP/FNR family transcriptional regulator, cyclic AMP receptor protein